MGELNGAFIDTAMITISVKLTNKKKEQNRQRTENVVANVKYAVSNFTLCKETGWSFGQP